MHREDARWIRETLQGDRATFGNLVRKYQDRLYRSMVLVAGSQEDALDVVQDAFVAALVNLGTFQAQCQFYTWLYRIAYNLALKARRRQRLRQRTQAAVVAARRTDRAHCPTHRMTGPGPERQLERDEICRQVREAIAGMSESYRSVIVLREIDGLDYEDIARVLDLPKGTVRSRLHRARLQLLNRLQEGLVECER